MIIDNLELAAIEIPSQPPHSIECGQRFPFYLCIVLLSICDGSGYMRHRPPVYILALHPGMDLAVFARVLSD